jgi:hypothetical protein
MLRSDKSIILKVVVGDVLGLGVVVFGFVEYAYVALIVRSRGISKSSTKAEILSIRSKPTIARDLLPTRMGHN